PSRPERSERRAAPAALFAAYAPTAPYNEYWWAVQAIVSEVSRGFQFLVGLPVVLGIWLFRRRMRYPAYWFMLGFALLQGLILWRLATVIGYLSERHVIILVLCGVFPAA